MRLKNVNGNVKIVRLRLPNRVGIFRYDNSLSQINKLNELLCFDWHSFRFSAEEMSPECNLFELCFQWHEECQRQILLLEWRLYCKHKWQKNTAEFDFISFIFYSFFFCKKKTRSTDGLWFSVIYNLIGADFFARSAFFASCRLRASTTPTLPLRAKRWLRTNFASIWNELRNQKNATWLAPTSTVHPIANGNDANTYTQCGFVQFL